MLFQGYMVLARSPSKPDFYLSLLPEIFLGRIVQFSFLIHEKQLIKNSCCLSLSPSLSITRFLPGPALPRRQSPTPVSLCFFFHWCYIIKRYQPYVWHSLYWFQGTKKNPFLWSCDNTQPKAQINLLVIAHLNISDHSFNINSEFYSSPSFHIYAFISMPLFKSYKGLGPCKDTLL